MKFVIRVMFVVYSLQVAQATTDENRSSFLQRIDNAYQQRDKANARVLLSELDVLSGNRGERALARLRLLAALEAYDNAAIEAASFLENEDFDGYLAENLNEISSVFSAMNEAKGEPNASGAFIEHLVGYYSKKHLSSDVLLKLNLLEQFSLLHALAKHCVEPDDYDGQGILARAYGNCFKTKAYGGLKDKSAKFINKRDLSKKCTAHYENAVKQAPSQYLRSQLANAWFALGSRSDFNVDSPLLKTQLSIASLNVSDHATIKEQTRLFRAELRKAMASGKQSSVISEESRNTIADALSLEFESFARVGIPDSIFQSILRDMYFFFDEGLPMFFVRQAHEIRELRPTLRWYLWYAIIEPIPSDFERKVIESQIRYMVRTSFDPDDSVPLSGEYKTRLSKGMAPWLELFGRLRDNRFVPYFKQACVPHLFSLSCQSLQKDALQQLDRLIKQLDLLREQDASNVDYQRLFDTTVFFSTVGVYANYLAWDRPAFKFLPDRSFASDSGTMNKYNVYTFWLSGKP